MYDSDSYRDGFDHQHIPLGDPAAPLEASHRAIPASNLGNHPHPPFHRQTYSEPIPQASPYPPLISDIRSTHRHPQMRPQHHNLHSLYPAPVHSQPVSPLLHQPYPYAQGGWIDQDALPTRGSPSYEAAEFANATYRSPKAPTPLPRHPAPADPAAHIIYRTPEHPRLRTAQACEKCRTRKAKCSGDHPSCQRCLTRGLACEYAKEGRMRGPNKPKGARAAAGAGVAAARTTSHAPDQDSSRQGRDSQLHPDVPPRGTDDTQKDATDGTAPHPARREEEHRSAKSRPPDLRLDTSSPKIYRHPGAGSHPPPRAPVASSKPAGPNGFTRFAHPISPYPAARQPPMPMFQTPPSHSDNDHIIGGAQSRGAHDNILHLNQSAAFFPPQNNGSIPQPPSAVSLSLNSSPTSAIPSPVTPHSALLNYNGSTDASDMGLNFIYSSQEDQKGLSFAPPDDFSADGYSDYHYHQHFQQHRRPAKIRWGTDGAAQREDEAEHASSEIPWP